MDVNKALENFSKIEHHGIVMRDLKGYRYMVDGLIELINRLELRKGQKMVEIGSYYGGSAVLFASSGIDIECVDLWAPYDSVISPIVAQQPEGEWERIEALFDKNTKPFPNVHKHKGMSMDAVKDFEDDSLDFVYIDGNHTYESCLEDIKAWLPKVKKSGWIGGHDYSGAFVGLQKAVKESFPTFITFQDTSWAVKL